MKSPYLLSLVLAGLAAAQNGGSSNTSLTDALGSQNDTLSELNGLLSSQPDLVQALGSLDNITVLAPSNDALESFLNSNTVKALLGADAGIITALLRYHVLNGTYYANDIPDTPVFVETLLSNQTYENVTGGQVVEAVRDGDDVIFYSGLRSKANVTRANLNFTGGVVHIIDEVLRIPPNLTETAIAANLSAVTGAITEANLSSTLAELRNITVFAPNNAAFAEIGSVVANLSSGQLESILEYHVVEGTIGYSSTLRNTSLETLEGKALNITVNNGTVYVNEAEVVIPDVLIANGVVHVIDGVLNPNNTEAANPTNTEPAFTGASSVSEVPFTSGVPRATEGGATGLTTASSTEGAVPQATGALAMGALFGGAAILVNGL